MRNLKYVKTDAEIEASSGYTILWYSEESDDCIVTKKRPYIILSANGSGSIKVKEKANIVTKGFYITDWADYVFKRNSDEDFVSGETTFYAYDEYYNDELYGYTICIENDLTNIADGTLINDVDCYYVYKGNFIINEIQVVSSETETGFYYDGYTCKRNSDEDFVSGETTFYAYDEYDNDTLDGWVDYITIDLSNVADGTVINDVDCYYEEKGNHTFNEIEVTSSTVTSQTETISYEAGDNQVFLLEKDAYAVNANNDTLTAIELPETMIEIVTNSFVDCSNLTSVTVNNTMQNINDRAFANCNSIKTITYKGSLDSWNTINNCWEDGTDITVYCSDGSEKQLKADTNIYIINTYYLDENSAYNRIAYLNYDWRTEGDNYIELLKEDVLAIYVDGEKINIDDLYVYDNSGNISFYYTATTLTSGYHTIKFLINDVNLEHLSFYNCDTITSSLIGKGILTLPSNMFYDCSILYSVTIPDSVTSIGDNTFGNCYFTTSSLVNNSSVTGYPWGATIVDEITEDGLCIKDNAVIHYTNKSKSVNIPNTVTAINSSVFRGCTSLTSVTIPDSVTSIGNYAFYNCSSLYSVTIPSSVTSIGSNAFYGCYFTNSSFVNNSSATGYPWGATIVDEITEDGLCIKNNVVIHCLYNATSVTIPDNVTSIGDRAFYSCTSLTSVTIPDSVTSIGTQAFDRCSSLSSVTIPDSVTYIGQGSFELCTNLTSITIPNNVSGIYSATFSYCRSLTSVTIPDSVTSIGQNAFSNCSSLTSITIPDSVTSIGSYTFYNCTSLTSITIPDSVTSIGSYTFYNCTSLNEYNFGNTRTTVPTLSNTNAFYLVTSASVYSTRKIIVPDSLYDTWKTATNWSSTSYDIVNRITKYSDVYPTT